MSNNTEVSDQRLWTKKDCAAFLQVSERQVTNMMQRGAIPYLKLGTPGARRVAVRFDPVAVKKSITKQFAQ